MGNFNIKLEIMDTPGQDVTLTSGSITSRVFVFLIFDVSDKNSFGALRDYIDNFNNRNDNPCKLLYIVGNKCDK